MTRSILKSILATVNKQTIRENCFTLGDSMSVQTRFISYISMLIAMKITQIIRERL